MILFTYSNNSINTYSDAIWRHKTLPALIQVMACCLVTKQVFKVSIYEVSLKMTLLKSLPHLPEVYSLVVHTI